MAVFNDSNVLKVNNFSSGCRQLPFNNNNLFLTHAPLSCMAGVQRGRESEINAKDVSHVRAHIVTWQCALCHHITWPMSFLPIFPFPPQPAMQSHSAQGSKFIRVSSNHLNYIIIFIINYKPKMELLFILHDFMLPPSFLIQPHLPQLSFSKSWAGMDWKGSGTRHCCGSEAALVFWSST